MKLMDLLTRFFQKLNTTASLGAMLFWNAHLILIVAALLVADHGVRLSLLLAYLAVMVFVLVTKIKLEKAIFDQSATNQLRDELNAHRESMSISSYLDSVMEPKIPIWYRRAYKGYFGSPKMLKELFNLILEFKPKRILELGSGLTTLIASYALRKNGNGKVVSWDCIETRASGNREMIHLHEQNKYSEIVDAKISKSREIDGIQSWFDQKPKHKIDFLIVDDSTEPPLSPGAKNVIETLRSDLNMGCIILLHDRIRPVDNVTLNHWLDLEPNLNLIHTVQTKTNIYSVLRIGQRLNSRKAVMIPSGNGPST